ncbi:MAG: hypothetical protein ACSLE6_09555 [Mycobacterium sp.]
MATSRKTAVIDELAAEFRKSCSAAGVFDTVAADLLHLNRTDLQCVNIVENAC